MYYNTDINLNVAYIAVKYQPMILSWNDEPNVGTIMTDYIIILEDYKRLGTQSLGWWFEMASRSLWRHCNQVDGSAVCLFMQQRS